MVVRFLLFSDYLLVEPQDVAARKVFTPFYKLRQQIPKRSVQPMMGRIQTAQKDSPPIPHIDLMSAKPEDFGGSTNLHRSIDHIEQHMRAFDYNGYQDTRNIPSIDGSSRLSPYLRFGLVSIRQLYSFSIRVNSQVYTSELAWREFRHHIAYRFPESLTLEFQEKRRNLTRENHHHLLQARKEGMT
jgi:deoxyribodipyrimidine photo-lyase